MRGKYAVVRADTLGTPGSRAPDRRRDSCWFGTGNCTKVRAWDAALEIARANGLAVAR